MKQPTRKSPRKLKGRQEEVVSHGLSFIASTTEADFVAQDSSGSSDGATISSGSASSARAKRADRGRPVPNPPLDPPPPPVASAEPGLVAGTVVDLSAPVVVPGPDVDAIQEGVTVDAIPVNLAAAPPAAPATRIVATTVAAPNAAAVAAPGKLDGAAPLAQAGLFSPAPPFQGAPGGFANSNGGVVYYAPLNLVPAGNGERNPIGAFITSLFRTLTDMVRFFVFALKYPAILLVACYVCLLATGYILDTATDTLAPVCALFPRFYPCRATTAADAVSVTFGNLGRKFPVDIRRIDFPGLMSLQSRTLDQLLVHSSAGAHLALGVKHAELAVKDLGIVVKASNLTSKMVLARSLEEFAQDAKLTGRRLQHLSAKMYGAVDRYVCLLISRTFHSALCFQSCCV